MTAAPKAEYVVRYEGADVSADIAPELESITFNDELHLRSDTIEIRIADRTGKWRGSWYPVGGDRLSVALGWAGAPLLDCGTFVVDAPEFSGAPDVVTIRGTAAPRSQALRTPVSRAFESVTLADIVRQVADANGLTLRGDPPDLRFERVTQNREAPLAFLGRLAREHGYAMSVRDTQLSFYELATLEEADEVLTLRRTDLSSYSLKPSTLSTYTACEVTYQNPRTGRRERTRVTASGDEPTGGDTLRRTVRVENPEQADAIARSLLADANRTSMTGTIACRGNTSILAGQNIGLTDLDKLDGRYAIRKSTHTVDRSASYKTSAEVGRV